MKIHKTDLVKKIKQVKDIIPNFTTMPALQGVLVKDGYFITTNLDTTICVELEEAKGENFIIPKEAIKLIDKLPNKEVEITAEGDTITIKTGRIKNAVKTFTAEQFPEVKTPTGGEFTVDGTSFIKAIRRTLVAVAKKNPSPLMCALYLQADGEKLNVVGIDGRRAAWDRVPCEEKFCLLIPRQAAEMLANMATEEEIKAYYSKTAVEFVIDDKKLTTRLVDGQYYAYASVFPEMPLRLEVEKDGFLSAIDRAGIYAVMSKKPIRLHFADQVLSLAAENSTSDYKEEIEYKGDVEEIEIGFDPTLVSEALKSFDEDMVTIWLKNPQSPMIVTEKGSKLAVVVMPVMIRE